MAHSHPSTELTDAVRPLLRTRRFGRPLRGYVSVGSTNERAAAWAREGAEEGSVVVAELQTAGRGRLGRSWQADAGRNLTFSLVLRPALPPDRLSLVILAAGLAVTDAVAAFTAPLPVQIKWPNDILLEGRKCGGMLLEHLGGSGGTRPPALILGVGLNVNQDTFPDTFLHPPTSLLLATGRHAARAPLLAELLLRLEAHYDRLGRPEERTRLPRAYEERLFGLGERLHFRATDRAETVEGVVRGITETGALRLLTEEGERTFAAGELTSHAGTRA